MSEHYLTFRGVFPSCLAALAGAALMVQLGFGDAPPSSDGDALVQPEAEVVAMTDAVVSRLRSEPVRNYSRRRDPMTGKLPPAPGEPGRMQPLQGQAKGAFRVSAIVGSQNNRSYVAIIAVDGKSRTVKAGECFRGYCVQRVTSEGVWIRSGKDRRFVRLSRY